MKIALWISQILLALVFFLTGAIKLFAFDELAASAPYLADQPALATFIGIAELAGAIGLILPGLTGVFPFLTTWAAIGVATILVLATGLHLMRGEVVHAVVTVILLALASFVIYGRGFRNEPVSN
ncbi:MAG TPA: DoxX family protein [Candidatus Methylacidiphilales bacterium]